MSSLLNIVSAQADKFEVDLPLVIISWKSIIAGKFPTFHFRYFRYTQMSNTIFVQVMSRRNYFLYVMTIYLCSWFESELNRTKKMRGMFLNIRTYILHVFIFNLCYQTKFFAARLARSSRTVGLMLHFARRGLHATYEYFSTYSCERVAHV